MNPRTIEGFCRELEEIRRDVRKIPWPTVRTAAAWEAEKISIAARIRSLETRIRDRLSCKAIPIFPEKSERNIVFVRKD